MPGLQQIHFDESQVTGHIDGSKPFIELDTVKGDELAVDRGDIRQVEIAVKLPDEPLAGSGFEGLPQLSCFVDGLGIILNADWPGQVDPDQRVVRYRCFAEPARPQSNTTDVNQVLSAGQLRKSGHEGSTP